MSQDTPTDAICPVFEVHRVGNVNQVEASQLELSDIARKYTELVPITSIEQLQKAKALAVVPPESMFCVLRRDEGSLHIEDNQIRLSSPSRTAPPLSIFQKNLIF